jgi:hypothetical protein
VRIIYKEFPEELMTFKEIYLKLFDIKVINVNYNNNDNVVKLSNTNRKEV